MLNQTVIVGRMVRDPELRYSKDGMAVCSFTLAVARAFKKDEADFIPVVCFKKVAENVANYQKKGSLVGVTGRIQTRNYENKDGVKVYVTEVIADQVAFLGSKDNGQGEAKQSQGFPNKSGDSDPFQSDGKPLDISDDDLPF